MRRVFAGVGLGAILALTAPISAFAQSDPFAPTGVVPARQAAEQQPGAPLRIVNGSFEAAVSAEQLSRITIIGDRVVSVRTLQDPEGPQMLVEAEEATGDVYVGFDGPALGRTFSLFLVTASGRTVQANLNVSSIAGQTIQVAGAATALDNGASVERSDRRSDYMETVTAMMRVMFRGDTPEGLRCLSRSGAARDVGPYTMTVVRTCEAAGLRGQEIVLHNKSTGAAPILVDPFIVAGVLAAGADREELLPGGTGRVFLVEEAR